jgi:signal peptidase I
LVKKNSVLVSVLVVIVAITSAGWILAELKPQSVRPLPAGVENWTYYFRGYEAYLDQRIFSSIVHGTSMEPTLGENDLVLWVRADADALKVGDIIIFQHPTRPYIDNVVHRIVEVQLRDGKYMFRTRGDNSGLDQNLVPESNVHGLVIGVVYRSDR